MTSFQTGAWLPLDCCTLKLARLVILPKHRHKSEQKAYSGTYDTHLHLLPRQVHSRVEVERHPQSTVPQSLEADGEAGQVAWSIHSCLCPLEGFRHYDIYEVVKLVHR